jgi:hypothetical protein
MTLTCLANIGTLISGIVALIGVPIAIVQLIGLRKSAQSASESANHANLMSIFNIEFELNRRKERMAEIRQKVLDKTNGRDSANIPEEEKNHIKSLEEFRKEAYEDYLNVFDRLAYFILKGKFDEEDFRLEYRDMLFSTIDNDEEGFFHGKTTYRNMSKLYDKWKEK